MLSRAVIKALAVAGGTASVLVAPNAAQLIATYMRHLDKKDALRTLHYLKYHKLIEVRTLNGEQEYRLTQAGRRRYKKLTLDELSIPAPSRWDHKWRMVIFDIPKYKQLQRDEFLSRIKQLQFYMLQRSVWIHPFECSEQIGLLLHELDLEKEVSYMVVENGNFVAHAERYYQKNGLLI